MGTYWFQLKVVGSEGERRSYYRRADGPVDAISAFYDEFGPYAEIPDVVQVTKLDRGRIR